MQLYTSFICSMVICVFAAMAGCSGSSQRGENLHASGGAKTMPIENVPPSALVIEVDDDGKCVVENERFPSLDDVIPQLKTKNFGFPRTILLRSRSKRAPSDESLSRLCDYASSDNLDLFGVWPTSGGTLVLGAGDAPSAANHESATLLVRSRKRDCGNFRSDKERGVIKESGVFNCRPEVQE